MANLILDPPETHPRVDHVSFGKDGMPFFVSGPYDDDRKCKFVIDTLMRTCREGNFHYLLNLGGMPD
jgi:hypothetical protein